MLVNSRPCAPNARRLPFLSSRQNSSEQSTKGWRFLNVLFHPRAQPSVALLQSAQEGGFLASHRPVRQRNLDQAVAGDLYPRGGAGSPLLNPRLAATGPLLPVPTSSQDDVNARAIHASNSFCAYRSVIIMNTALITRDAGLHPVAKDFSG